VPSDPERLRAVDLARQAGISVQQVRNYVDLGLLPAPGLAGRCAATRRTT
jgi:hypothetical protein